MPQKYINNRFVIVYYCETRSAWTWSQFRGMLRLDSSHSENQRGIPKDIKKAVIEIFRDGTRKPKAIEEVLERKFLYS